MGTNIKKTIYKKIKKYNKIVIARHIGADPDGLASQIALRDVIINTFPKKKVYAVGLPASKFKFLGVLDKLGEEDFSDALLIVVDTPDRKRIDSADPALFKETIKIDHHPFIEKTCNIEWIDESASSASQMIIEMIFETKLKLTKEAAEKLFIGIIADTNRFLFYYTTPKTFNLVAKLIKYTNIDFTSLYEALYLKPIKEVKFQGYLANNFTITEHGLAYIKVNNDILKEYGIDAATARNMVGSFNYIDEILVWMIFTLEEGSDVIKGSIRSRGPIVNEVATKYNGGGHIYASGVRLNSEDDILKLVNDLEQVCSKYLENE